MDVLKEMQNGSHEQVLFCRDASVGLSAIIAIHSTALGPSLGGLRIWPYRSTDEALTDVLRLSQGMTRKSAIAGLDLGGGKSVLIADPTQLTEGMLRAFGRHVHALGGRYLVAEDMNTTEREMEWIADETPYVTGVSPHRGGLGAPGPVTALGTFHAVRATLARAVGSADPKGRTVAIQGLGSVGWSLAQQLRVAGARLIVADVNEERTARAKKKLGADVAHIDEILEVACDVLSPCAVGAVIGDHNLDRLSARAICGAANNILVDEFGHGEQLVERGIPMAPDYVVNAGGVIAMYAERHGWGLSWANERSTRIYDTVLDVFHRATEAEVSPQRAATDLAEERIETIQRVRRMRNTR